MKAVDPIKALHHRERAESFSDAMHLLRDDMPTYGQAVALLAVHTTISLADALLTACTGRRSNELDHQEAMRPLGNLCGSEGIQDRSGLKHFGWLVGKKTYFAYGDDRVSAAELELALQKAERFRAWVYRSFRYLLQEGA